MKKLFLFATAALVLASCNNDVTISENTALAGSNAQKEIAFTPYAQMPKRAASASDVTNAVADDKYPKNYNMKVVAYSVPESGTPGNYFGNATADGGILFGYKYAGGSQDDGHAAYWGGVTAPQYWPLASATLNFLAVSKGGSPTADVVSPQFRSNYASGVTVTLNDNKPQTAASVDGQHDLMYAFGRASVTQTGNVLIFPDKVDMTFNHALAWVNFRIKAGNAASTAISIKGIKLNGAYYGGTFDAVVDNYSSASDALAWNTTNTKWTAASSQSHDIYSPNFASAYNHRGATGEGDNDSKSLINGTFFDVGDGILVVPTSEITPATNSISSFDIEYYLNGNLYTYHYVPAVLTYEKGKKYIYDITMTLHEIFVNASVAEWDETAPVENIDITPISYAHNAEADNTGNFPTAGTIAANAGIYSFQVTGLKSTDDVTVAAGTGGTGTLTSVTHVYNTTTKVATVTFEVPANAANTAKTYVIDITDNGTSGSNHKTTITVNQAAAE